MPSPIKLALQLPGLIALIAAMSAAAGQLRLDTPQASLQALRKIQCSLKDGDIGSLDERLAGPDRIVR